MLLPALAIVALAAQAAHAASVYAPLSAYSGTWQVTYSGAASKPGTLVNQCAELGKDFACGRVLDGAAAGMIVFIAKGSANHYITQTIMPDGRAGGVVMLDIDGSTWTYSSRRDEYGKTTFYRTVNVFSGKSKIHFSNEHSTDQKNWTVESSGDEVKLR